MDLIWSVIILLGCDLVPVLPRRPGTRQASGQTQAEVVDLKKRRTTRRMLEPVLHRNARVALEIRTPDLRITSRKREFTVQSPHLPVFADMRNAVCPGLMAAAGVLPTAPH